MLPGGGGMLSLLGRFADGGSASVRGPMRSLRRTPFVGEADAII